MTGVQEESGARGGGTANLSNDGGLLPAPGNLSFDEYCERWDLYFEDVEIFNEVKKRNMFVHYQGDESFALISRLSLPMKQSEPSKMVYKDQFHQRVQGKGEPAVEFVTELTRLANKCSFKERDEQLLARIISGMRNTSLKEKMLAEEESTLKLEKVVERIYAAERAAKAARDLSEAAAVEVHKIFKKYPSSQGAPKFPKKSPASPSNGTMKCFACGTEGHKKPDCKFKNSACYNCGKKGHLSKVCRSEKKASRRETHQVEEFHTSTSPSTRSER
jgi:Zinc knuckle